MIATAAALLDAPYSRVLEHVESRLANVFRIPRDNAIQWLATRDPCERTELATAMAQLLRHRSRHVEVRRTSGSTGTPFTFVKSRHMTSWMDAAMWAAYSWHGVRPGQRHARFWGTPFVTTKRISQRLRDRLLNRRRLSAFEVTDAQSARYFASLVRHRPYYAYGYPNVIAAFADRCRASRLDGRDIRLSVIICTGELLTPERRDEISRFFDCPVVNEYGCTESGLVAFECKFGSMHLIPVAAFPQVVRNDGAPAAVGEDGEIVVTDLYGAAAPLLRYRLHDWGRLVVQPCQCGRELPQLEITRGRIDSFIETPRGPVYDAILAYNVPKGVRRFRVRQTAIDKLEAEIVVDTGAEPVKVALTCEQRWAHALGGELTVIVRVVDAIAAERSGKLQYFVPLQR